MLETNRRPEIGVLTATRFFAALWVVIYHYWTMLDLPAALGPLLNRGQLAVSFFFVLSGFVLTYNYFAPGTPVRMGPFLRNRVARLLPAHATVLVGVLVGVLATAGVAGLSWSAALSWLAYLGMVQAWLPLPYQPYNWNGPAWSISCELAFYLAFPWLLGWLGARLRGERDMARALGVTFVLGLVACGPQFALPLLVKAGLVPAAWQYGLYIAFYTWPPIRCWDFVAGCVVGLWLDGARRSPEAFPWCTRLLARRAARERLVLGALALTLALLHVQWPTQGPVGLLMLTIGPWAIYLPLASLVVLGLATGPTLVGRCLDFPWLRVLGEASYALYLLHVPVRNAVLGSPWAQAHQPLASWLAIAATIALAVAIYHAIEIPMRRRIRDLRLFGEPTARPSPSGSP